MVPALVVALAFVLPFGAAGIASVDAGGVASPVVKAAQSLDPNVYAASRVKLPKTLKKGQTFKWGKYGGKQITWKVLSVEDNKALVISKYIIDWRPYHTTSKRSKITWAKSSIRKWLNGSFYKAAFTAKERKKILKTTVKNKDNPSYGTNGGKNTKDKIFLLSYEEVFKYFYSGGVLYVEEEYEEYLEACKAKNKLSNSVINAIAKRKVKSGEFETMSEAKAHIKRWNGKADIWWLRSPGRISGLIEFIYDWGDVNETGDAVFLDYGIRPAMWVKFL